MEDGMKEQTHNSDRPVAGLVGASFVGGILALLTTSCCVLPMVLMLAGLGGAWLAVFSPIVAVSIYVLPLAGLCVGAAWVVVLQRPTSRRMIVLLILSSVLTGLGGLIYLFQAQLNDYLISLM